MPTLAILAASTPAHGERKTLEGTWSMTAISERWNIGKWGPGCGPRPRGRGAGGGQVQVSVSGADLTFSGGGYPSTRGCFDMGGPIRVISHTGSSRFWRTICASPKTDSRRARITTTLNATGQDISFDEVGEYSLVMGGEACTATVRRTRHYHLIRRKGEEKPAPAESSKPAESKAPPAAEPPKSDDKSAKDKKAANHPPGMKICEVPGDPSRIEVYPARKLMKPGEEFRFKVALLDPAGCIVRQPAMWKPLTPKSKLTIGPDGTVKVPSDSPEGVSIFAAQARGRAVQVKVEVVSPKRYAALLKEGGFDASGKSRESASAALAKGGLGSDVAIGTDERGSRVRLFLGVLGGAVLLLGAVGVALMWRAKPKVVEIEETLPGEVEREVVQRKRLVLKENDQGTICPVCGRAYPSGAGFCPDDGSPLVRSKKRQPRRKKLCPSCGEQFESDASVCPHDGSSLIPIN